MSRWDILRHRNDSCALIASGSVLHSEREAFLFDSITEEDK
jgi:hypothetical protein